MRLVLLLTFLVSWPSFGNGTFLDRCLGSARRLSRLWHPPRVEKIEVAGSTQWIDATGRVLLNGTLINARDEWDKPVQLLVFSHYMKGHVDKNVALPIGWRWESFAHRGEYEFLDGVATRINETSGSADAAGEPNPLSAAEKSLEGTPLVDGVFTRWIARDRSREHLYPGFNEPVKASTGNPQRDRLAQAHGGRSRLLVSINFLDLALESRNGFTSSERCQNILDHWEMLTKGITPSDDLRLLKHSLELHLKHPSWTPDSYQATRLRAAIKSMREQQNRFQYLIIRPN